MRHILFLLIFFIAAAEVTTEAAAPPQRPYLVIDPGMHTGVIRGLDVSADGTLIATASDDKTARLWSVTENRLLKTFRLPMMESEAGRAYAVALSPDGATLATGGLDADAVMNHQGHYIYVFDTVSGRLRQRLGPVTQVIYDLDFSADGKRLAAGLGQGGGVLLWEAPFNRQPFHATDYTVSVNDLEFDAAGTLYVATEDGQISTYDQAFTPKFRFALPGGAIAQSFSVTADGKRMAFGYEDRAGIEIVSLPDFELVHKVDTGFVTQGNLGKVAWSGDGQTLFASGTYFRDDPDPFLIFAFPDGGKGKPRQIGDTMGSVLGMASLPNSGAVFSSALPSLGVLGGQDVFFGPANANMTYKTGTNFQISADGLGVWFGLGDGAKDPWLFDAATLTFEPAAKAPAGYAIPDVTSLPISNWEDNEAPVVSGSPVPMTPGDKSHAVAIVTGTKTFVIGTSWSLRRFDNEGGQFWNANSYGSCWGVNLSGDGELVVAAFDDGTIRWYTSADGIELLSLYVHVPSKRWIAWTPLGYYTASPGAEDLIGWHVNGKTWNETPSFYPASRFRDQFYRPDIVQRILVTKRERTAIKEADAAAGRKQQTGSIETMLPASVELQVDSRSIEAKTREITIPYRLTSPTGREVTKVDVRVDGRPVATRGISQAETGYPLGEDLFLTITLPQHDVDVSLIAFIGDQPGPAATIPVKWMGAGDGGKRHDLHALLIGVSAYGNPDMKLAYAAKDAKDIAAKLKGQEGVFYERVTVETLLDGDATKSAIEKQLALLKKRAAPEDTVLVFFAGHGMTSATYDFFYLATDSEMDADLLEATAVDGRLIRKILGSLPGRVVLMMDTCRSGAGIEGAVDMTRAANDMAQDTAGIVMFASSQGREDSLESRDWENGAFTEALLSILDDAKVYGDDGRLSIPELEEAVTVRVSELTGGRQNAGMTKYGATPRFFIAGMK